MNDEAVYRTAPATPGLLISDIPFDQRSLIHREARFPPCFVRQNQPKKNIIFGAAILNTFQTKMFKSETPSFRYFSPKILNILDIQIWEVGKKDR